MANDENTGKLRSPSEWRNALKFYRSGLQRITQVNQEFSHKLLLLVQSPE